MIPEEALQLVPTRLDDFGIPHMITGSFASSMHGVPRATQDADVVIEADQDSLDKFVESLGGEFYASPEAARGARERKRMFNIVPPFPYSPLSAAVLGVSHRRNVSNQ